METRTPPPPSLSTSISRTVISSLAPPGPSEPHYRPGRNSECEPCQCQGQSPAPSLEQHLVLHRTPDVKQPSTFSLLCAGNTLMLLLRLILLYLFDQSSCGFSSLYFDFFLNVAFSERIGTPFLVKYSSWVGLGQTSGQSTQHLCKEKSPSALQSVARCQVTSCNCRCQASFTM